MNPFDPPPDPTIQQMRMICEANRCTFLCWNPASQTWWQTDMYQRSEVMGVRPPSQGMGGAEFAPAPDAQPAAQCKDCPHLAHYGHLCGELLDPDERVDPLKAARCACTSKEEHGAAD